MKTVIVIPARIGSTRFPKKVLYPILGKPMIQWVYEGAKKSEYAEKIFIATDSEEVKKQVELFGAEAILTPSELPSGTDRVFYAIKDLDVKYVINLQGDEPLITGEVLDKIFFALFEGNCDIATPYYSTNNKEEAENPNRVKIVSDINNYALYFSRSLIPFYREATENYNFKIHIGVYGFTKESLKKFVSLPQSFLEKTEKLEQLRALENGMRIKLVEVQYKPCPVDTLEDIEEVEKRLKLQLG
jgi:3-deoxy-manno-octulosonate cytidylyltransferase (CMP-KDO synthetase)